MSAILHVKQILNKLDDPPPIIYPQQFDHHFIGVPQICYLHAETAEFIVPVGSSRPMLLARQ